MTLPNPSYQPPDGEPTEAFPAMPAPSMTATWVPVKRGWPTGAKVTAVVLAVTTLGAAAAGVVLSSSAKGDTKDVKKELATANSQLTKTKTDLEALKQDLGGAQGAATQAKADLTTAQGDLARSQSDRDAAVADRDRLKGQLEAVTGLFPFGLDKMAGAAIVGSWKLAISGKPVCTGYADDAAACSESSLPSAIDIQGDAKNGYSVTSGSAFGPTPLLRSDAIYATHGVLDPSSADVCNGAPATTAYTLKVSVVEVTLDNGQLGATKIVADLTMGAQASGSCTATSRSVSYVGTPG
jgi:hypothetical protein